MNRPTTPQDLPIPRDDGAADHLQGMALPELLLTATDGKIHALHKPTGWLVIYIYPRTGQPGVPLPEGWEQIPGAMGCTPQSCGFRDNHRAITERGVELYGLSSQETDYQQEAKRRLELPFELLSDPDLQLKKQLNLPTFQAAGMELYKRITLILHNGTIKRVIYPVFPPGDNAAEVLMWLESNS